MAKTKGKGLEKPSDSHGRRGERERAKELRDRDVRDMADARYAGDAIRPAALRTKPECVEKGLLLQYMVVWWFCSTTTTISIVLTTNPYKYKYTHGNIVYKSLLVSKTNAVRISFSQLCEYFTYSVGTMLLQSAEYWGTDFFWFDTVQKRSLQYGLDAKKTPIWAQVLAVQRPVEFVCVQFRICWPVKNAVYWYIPISYLLRPCSTPNPALDLRSAFCAGEYTLRLQLDLQAPLQGRHLFSLHQVLFYGGSDL